MYSSEKHHWISPSSFPRLPTHGYCETLNIIFIMYNWKQSMKSVIKREDSDIPNDPFTDVYSSVKIDICHLLCLNYKM